MRSLRVIEILGDSPTFTRHHRLRLPEGGDVFTLHAEHDSGAFGYVWSAQPAEPRPAEPNVVIKLVKEENSLAGRVIALQEALAAGRVGDWPELLLAFPFSVGRAEIEGDECEAIFMLDLTELGYEKAKGHFAQSRAEEYQRRPEYERVEFAHSYARAAAALEAIGFLHGDQNLDNLMLNPRTLDVQIIDFDAGAILVTGTERSLAAGKPDDARPPEAVVPTPDGLDVDRSLWDVGAERWAVGVLVGYLSFGISPAFFLVSTSVRNVVAYAQQGPWPQVDLQSFFVRPGIGPTHKYWRPFLEAAPGWLTETFARFFKAGTRGGDRPTAQDWVEALDGARRQPEFTSLEVEPAVAPEGTEVYLSWEATGAEYVESPELGRLPAKGREPLVAHRPTRYSLTAVNFYGRTQAASGVIRVVPLPRLTTIPIGAFPGLRMDTRIATGAPALPPELPPPRLTRSLPVAPGPRTIRGGEPPLPSPPRFGALFEPIPVPRRPSSLRRKEPTE